MRVLVQILWLSGCYCGCVCKGLVVANSVCWGSNVRVAGSYSCCFEYVFLVGDCSDNMSCVNTSLGFMLG